MLKNISYLRIIFSVQKCEDKLNIQHNFKIKAEAIIIELRIKPVIKQLTVAASSVTCC